MTQIRVFGDQYNSMSTVYNPYGSKELETMLVKAAMHDSPINSNAMNISMFEQALAGHMQCDPLEDNTTHTHDGAHKETIDFEEDLLLCIPPLFNQMLHEEVLQEEECPYVLWATLKLHICPNLGSLSNAVFDGLFDFLEAVTEEDKHFVVFSYNLSEYTSIEELLTRITQE